MTNIELREVRFAFGRAPVLHGVDLGVRGGEVVCLAGPNGAGKSTLLHILGATYQGYSGTVTIDGAHPGDDEARLRTGLLSAPPPLYDQLSVREHLELLSRLWRRGGDTAQSAAETVGLGSRLDTLAGHMSLGQRQRLALALVTLHRPRWLLLDEPFNGLDRQTITLLREKIAAHASAGGGVLVATHLFEALEGLVTRLVYLHEGRVLHDVPVSGRRLGDVVDEVAVEGPGSAVSSGDDVDDTSDLASAVSDRSADLAGRPV